MESKLSLRSAVILIAWLAVIACSLPAQESGRAAYCKLVSAPQPQYPKLVFDYIRLDPSSDVSNDVWQSIVTSIKQRDLDAHPGWIEEMQQAGVVFALLNQGYVRPKATVAASNISSDSTHQHVGLAVHIETGPQYRVSSISFRSSDPAVPLFLRDAELRSLVPLEDGEAFSSSELRLAFNRLRKTYEAQGYVDFVPSPDMKFDNVNHQIAIVLELDQGKQYRLGTITVRGLSPPLENELWQDLWMGNAFDSQLIDNFYDAHRSELSADAASPDVERHKDLAAGTIDLVFDFRICAQVQPEQPSDSQPARSARQVLRKKVDPAAN